jgi:hypothetical protein
MKQLHSVPRLLRSWWAHGVDEAAAAGEGEGEGEVAGDDDIHFSKLSKLSSGAIVLVGLSYGTQLVA